eukprot:5092881-Amphidinium_carterae.1
MLSHALEALLGWVWVCRSQLKDAKLTPSEIDDIVLVGGSTRIPKIQEMLSEQFGGRQLCRLAIIWAPLDHTHNTPHRAGAHWGADFLLAWVMRLVGPSIQMKLLHTGLQYRVQSWQGGAGFMKPRIPCKKSQMYTTEEDYEEALDIRIFEGSALQ